MLSKITILAAFSLVMTGLNTILFFDSDQEKFNENLSLNQEILVQKFKEMDAALNNEQGYSNYDNDNGYLSWAQSYLLESYLDMYQVTQNVDYLKKFINQSDRIINCTDRARNITDYRGRSLLAWSTTKYSRDNARIVSLVDSGMITYPLSKFALLVNNNPELYQFEEKARYYINFVREALSVFDSDWEFDRESQEGFYRIFDYSVENAKTNISSLQTLSPPLPFNMQLAAGRSMIIICRLLDDDSFCQKAFGLAKHFKSNLKLYNNGSYVWQYWYGEGLDIYNAPEDISHGAIDIDFAILAYKSNIVFNQLDIFRFIQTYNLNISQNGVISFSVDGIGQSRPVIKESIGRWLEIAQYDCKVWHDFLNLLDSEQHSNHPQVMLGIAKALKYYEQCRPKEYQQMNSRLDKEIK